MVGIFQMKDTIYLQCGQALLTFSLPLYQHLYHFNSNFFSQFSVSTQICMQIIMDVNSKANSSLQTA